MFSRIQAFFFLSSCVNSRYTFGFNSWLWHKLGVSYLVGILSSSGFREMRWNFEALLWNPPFPTLTQKGLCNRAHGVEAYVMFYVYIVRCIVRPWTVTVLETLALNEIRRKGVSYHTRNWKDVCGYDKARVIATSIRLRQGLYPFWTEYRPM